MADAATRLSVKARRAGAAAALIGAMALAGCATRIVETPQPDSIGRAFEQPFRDLSLIREVAPEVLVQAAAAPYRAAPDCPSLLAELAALDRALGADLDRPPAKSGDGLAMELFGGVLGLPYGGVIRRLTGARERERAYKAAVLSGMVRRGFLKGSRRGLGCAAADTGVE